MVRGPWGLAWVALRSDAESIRGAKRKQCTCFYLLQHLLPACENGLHWCHRALTLLFLSSEPKGPGLPGAPVSLGSCSEFHSAESLGRPVWLQAVLGYHTLKASTTQMTKVPAAHAIEASLSESALFICSENKIRPLPHHRLNCAITLFVAGSVFARCLFSVNFRTERVRHEGADLGLPHCLLRVIVTYLGAPISWGLFCARMQWRIVCTNCFINYHKPFIIPILQMGNWGPKIESQTQVVASGVLYLSPLLCTERARWVSGSTAERLLPEPL